MKILLIGATGMAGKPESLAQRKVLALLRDEVTDLDWTYISPADEIAPGERTGTFRLGGDQMLTAADGSSLISATEADRST